MEIESTVICDLKRKKFYRHEEPQILLEGFAPLDQEETVIGINEDLQEAFEGLEIHAYVS